MSKRLLQNIPLFLFCSLFSTACSVKYPDDGMSYRTNSYSARTAPSTKPDYIPIRLPEMPGYNRNSDREAHREDYREPRVQERREPVSMTAPASERKAPAVKAAPPKAVNKRQLNSSLFEASAVGDSSTVNQLIEQGADVTSANSNGETALHSAAAKNQLEVAKILIRNGADVNAPTISGWTPVHSASRFGHVAVVVLLMDNGADVNVRNRDGKTATDLSVQAGHQDVIRTLQRY